MSVKDILLLGDERLYRSSQLVRAEELEKIKKVVEDLHETLMDFRAKYNRGRAIAAPQIGVFKRVIYINIDKPIAMVNPKLIYKGNEMITLWDDCMSFPNLVVKVERFLSCKIYYKDLEWKDHMMDVAGDLSELLQHEYDHLDGVLAVQRAIDDKSLKIKIL